LSLATLFERVERYFPDKAIVTNSPTGVERTDYGHWAERTRRLGGALDALGLSADARVGTFGWNTARHLELYFAPPCTGRVTHTLNIRLFPDQLAYVIDHAEDEVIFADRSVVALLQPLLAECKTVRHLVVMDDGAGAQPDVPHSIEVHDYETLLAESTPIEWRRVDEHDAAAMMYTSGTTGHPKGVVYSHRSIYLHTLGALTADCIGIRESDVILPVVPMFHANAWGLAHAAVATGATIVMPGHDLSPATLVQLIEAERVTVAAGVPTIWMGVLDALDGHDTASLRVIPCGGSAVPKALSEGFKAKTGLPLFQAWGMTETSPVASTTVIKSKLQATYTETQLADLRATVGLPLLGVDARIVEPDSDVAVANDGTARGELQVRGPWVASSYYRDERSGDSFTSDGWLRTGDVATVDGEGYISLVDRTKDLVKSGGEWISSVDLENEIMAHPGVREAAVIGISDPKWGERPLACVVARDGVVLTEADVLSFLADRVVTWWLPERVEFIAEIPRTSVGKFSKKTLRERFPT
jgi:fatty-acyl-CoA synthase